MKKVLLSSLIILQSIILLLVSYSWFSDKNSPSISETDIKVTSAEGLVLKLNPDSEARTNINLNEIMNDYSTFELKQMSSKEALDFYTIDFGAGLSNNLPTYVLINPSGELIDMERYGCVDYNFYLQTENLAKHVYFHKDTSITGFASDALRIAVTVDDTSIDEREIFGTTKENGDTYPYETEAVISAGEFVYNSTNNIHLDNQDVLLFEDRNGGRGTSDSAPIDLSKVLFTIPANTAVKVNIKVWLEGGDPDCDNNLSDTYIDLVLKFGSANVLIDAPNVFANNTYITITNLSTEMEYSLTNDENSVWTTVVDPSVEFIRGQTVYVRYAEVTGISPCSYVTTVIFNG